jgi:zinc protease
MCLNVRVPVSSSLFAQGKTRRITLGNGMKVIVQVDHGIPSVAICFFYRIGSRNERPGTTGISHFCEHMMFNGASKYGPGQFHKIMEDRGGRTRGCTYRDLTIYTDSFPSAALEMVFDLEADRIRDLTLDPKIVGSERRVICSERSSSVDNNNRGMLRELAAATAFIAHPYHWPVLGWPADIESLTVDDLKAHWKMGHAPNNCVMVVVGDVTFDTVFRLANKYLEAIPRRDPPPPVRAKEPEQVGERRVALVKPAALPMQMILYHVPESKSPDTQALKVLATLLDKGRSSRLFRALVNSELAISARAAMGRALDPSTCSFRVQPRSWVDPARTEAALYDVLAKLQTEEVPAAELRKARNQMLVDVYRCRKTIANRASLLGLYEIYYGDYAKMFTVDKDIEAVTAADVRRVARRYFTEKNRTVATLVPAKQEVTQ